MTDQESDPGDGRFEFGRNWLSFISLIDESRIGDAVAHTQKALGVSTLAGKSFLDIGCGSGLFSLAAVRMGSRVRSFDFDDSSVRAATILKSRFAPDAREWMIEQSSVLDDSYMKSLGEFDVVYSWGVLHHTGAMWKAMENAASVVRQGGLLYVAIYNDQGAPSRRWKAIKRLYSSGSRPLQWAILAGGLIYFQAKFMGHRILHARNPFHFLEAPGAKRVRGMNAWHDLIDWMGGYPFEVARPEEVIEFLRRRDFVLTFQSLAGGGLGCNEFVLRRTGLDPAHVWGGPDGPPSSFPDPLPR